MAAAEPARALYGFDAPRPPLPHPVRIALLGATGSIGVQAVELALRFPDRLRIVALAAHRRVDQMASLAQRLAAASGEAPWLALADPDACAAAAARPALRGRLLPPGDAGVLAAAALPEADTVVNAIVGAAGLAPTLAAASRGARIALANKESLVVGGGLVRAAAAAGGAVLLPVDSEHAAIAQCLAGRPAEEIESLTLTASGGPFLDLPAARLSEVTPAEVLQHPTWKMGPKITVDSATLMNKGLEVIEAHHLFGLSYDAIDVVVHPASVVHSLVTFRDGAVLAQLGCPDMRVPLLYALAGEKHWPLQTERLDLVRFGALAFRAPDLERFPCLRLARQAGREGGRAPIILNGANEVAVAALLAGRLRYVEIAPLIEAALARVPGGAVATLEEALAADREARAAAAALLR